MRKMVARARKNSSCINAQNVKQFQLGNPTICPSRGAGVVVQGECGGAYPTGYAYAPLVTQSQARRAPPKIIFKTIYYAQHQRVRKRHRRYHRRYQRRRVKHERMVQAYLLSMGAGAAAEYHNI